MQHFRLHFWPELHQVIALAGLRLDDVPRRRDDESDMKLIETCLDSVEWDRATMRLQLMLAGNLVFKRGRFLGCKWIGAR